MTNVTQIISPGVEALIFNGSRWLCPSALLRCIMPPGGNFSGVCRVGVPEFETPNQNKEKNAKREVQGFAQDVPCIGVSASDSLGLSKNWIPGKIPR